MTDAIVISGVTKTFGTKVAVRDLDLRVPAGSLTGFIGPNGAGKTTTIRMIMSIIFPDRGEVSVLGRASAVESKDRIGYLPEERGIYRKMKVGMFLTYMGRLKGIDGVEAKRRAAGWLERVGLKDVWRKKCEELSKGMQQKVQFIAAVIHEPELLILDEVFSGLDPVNRKLMRELIDELHTGGRTVVFSTHAMYEAEQLCDRIFMIHKGVKTLDMPMSEVWTRYDPRTVIVEPMNGAADENQWLGLQGVSGASRTKHGLELQLAGNATPERVIADIASRGGIRRVELKRANLEDVFIELVGGDRAALLAELEGAELSEPVVNGQGRA